MFAPHHLPPLIRYFEGIDSAISRRLMRAVPPTETTLTDEFCALMSGDNQRREGSLPYDVDALNADLSASGYAIDAEFRVAVHQHTPRMEAYVSQSDFGLVLEVENSVLPAASWSAAYLMQAKRLFRGSASDYDLGSTFRSNDAAQDSRVRLLSTILGEGCLKYFLYCPPTSGYEGGAVAAIRTLHADGLSRQIFDYATGLALHEQVKQAGGVDSGMWVAETQTPTRSASDLHSRAFKSAVPFTWFVLRHFDSPWHPDLMPEAQWEDAPARAARTRAFVEGDFATIEEVLDGLGAAARKAELDVEALTILPASTVTIRVQIGPQDLTMRRPD